MTDWPYPLWIAHRGAGKLAPENTLAAFRVGAAHGYRMFECDVKLSSDGIPFLLHDATLDRTVRPQRGIASQRSWSELSRLDAGGWHSRAFAGEPIPSLESLATWIRRNGFLLDLEIKPTPGDEQRTGEVVAREVARLWDGAAVPPLLTSFRPEALLAAQATRPELPRGLLLETFWDGWWDVARRLGCAAVITEHPMMDAALVARLHAAGLRAMVYTVNDPSVARHLVALGIDGIVTDAVDRFSPGAGVDD